MEELLPIGIGLALGVFLEVRRAPAWVRAMLVLLLAVGACVSSGEFRLCWGYLLAVTVEASTAAALGVCLIRSSRRMRTDSARGGMRTRPESAPQPLPRV